MSSFFGGFVPGRFRAFYFALDSLASCMQRSGSASNTSARYGASLARPSSRSDVGGWMDELRELPQAALPAAPVPTSLPRLSHPLRVEPPAEYNAPQRVSRLDAPDAKKQEKDQALSRLAQRPLTGLPTAKVQPERMRDYAVLGAACRRAGRMGSAAQLSFNRAVLFENMGEAAQALRCYKDLLRASLENCDAVAEALACNCIGVNIQLRGEAHKAELRGQALLRDAIGYHLQHLRIADVPGKFIAHCNLGLAYQSLGMVKEAAASHEQALRFAIRMSSLAGESLACGHLGAVNKVADAATAKACTERRLQLARTLNDPQGKGDAYSQLGSLAQSSRAWGEATHHYEQALHVAEHHHDRHSSDLARCNVGLAQGNMMFEDFLKSVIEPE